MVTSQVIGIYFLLHCLLSVIVTSIIHILDVNGAF